MTSGKHPAKDNKPPISSYILAPLRLPGFAPARRVRAKTIMPDGGLRQRRKSQSEAVDK